MINPGATRWTLVKSVDVYLRLLHPVMPFVTEELWGALPRAAGDPELLIVAAWPAAGARDAVVDAEVAAPGGRRGSRWTSRSRLGWPKRSTPSPRRSSGWHEHGR